MGSDADGMVPFLLKATKELCGKLDVPIDLNNTRYFPLPEVFRKICAREQLRMKMNKVCVMIGLVWAYIANEYIITTGSKSSEYGYLTRSLSHITKYCTIGHSLGVNLGMHLSLDSLHTNDQLSIALLHMHCQYL